MFRHEPSQLDSTAPPVGRGRSMTWLCPSRLLAAALLLLLMWSEASSVLAEPQNVSYRSSSRPIAITPDGGTLLVVNPDSNSLTLVDTASQRVLAELRVGLDPRSVAVSPDGSWACVANQGSDTVSVIDLQAGTVGQAIAVGDRPVGVAVSPRGDLVAVAELGEDRVRLLAVPTWTTRSLNAVRDRPHGLAFTPDGQTLLVTHLLSGDVTALSVEPHRLFLPIILKNHTSRPAAAISDTGGRLSPVMALDHSAGQPGSGESPAWSADIPRFAEHDNLENYGDHAAARGSALSSISISTWPNVAPAPSVAVNSAGTRAYLPQTMAHGQGLNTQFDNTVFPKVSVLNLVTQEHQSSEHISLPETDQPVGLPWDVALARSDSELWVVNAGSNDVSVVDLSEPSSPRRSAHIPVGHNPRGIAIHPDGHTAYVNNTLSGTVSVIDTSAYTVTSVITVTDIPLPPVLLSGKRLFHSSARPELAQARWISCNTCHIEGEQDGRTWLLQYTGEVPVGAQPIITRNTTSLLGMIETYPLRWSAEWDESADSEFSIRFEQFGTGLIDGPMHPTLGPPNQGRSWELDSLAAFIDSLQVPERSHPLSEAEQRGLALFQSPLTGCLTCHPAPLYTDLKQHDVGTASAYGEWFGPLIDTPTLRFMYDSAPYLHDGSAATLHDVLVTDNSQDPHGMASLLTEQEIDDLVAYLLALPHSSEEAAFTYQASSCLGEPTRTDGRIELWVEGCDILMTHRDAVYNCCAQVVVYPEWQGTLLKLVEQEEYPDREPCRCVCRIDLGASVANLQPGTYTVQVWDGVAQALLHEESVIVEPGCGGRDRSRFPSTMRSVP